MLQKLGDHIANCLARATGARRRAAEASNEALRADSERLAKSWRHLAASYQFTESLERFLLDADKRKAALIPDPPSVALFPPPGIAFDPDSLAALTAVYGKAIEGQPTSAHERIAQRIIALASKGERDPDKLCNGAPALSNGLQPLRPVKPFDPSP